jgi:cephalosporin hydroxylase
MKDESMVTIDGETVRVSKPNGELEEYGIGSPEAFRILSRLWLRSGWDLKHVYSFTWLGRPVIQLPEDMLRLQEVIFHVAPDVIIETGVAHGGSLVFYASLLQATGKGRVIGIDVEIRPHNRQAIEAHRLAPLITLIEGDSVAPATVEAVKERLQPGEQVMVCLDSNHTKEHVLRELECYSPLVTPGSYIVAMDGIMEEVVGAPRTEPDWSWNNPKQAALEFVAKHADFVIEEPAFAFNEGAVTERVTYWPCGFLRRIS